MRSRPLAGRRRMRWGLGKSNTVSPFGTDSSAHGARVGCPVRQVPGADSKSRSASLRSGALTIVRNGPATPLTGLPAGDEVRGVSLRMEPAAPPGQRRQHRLAGGFESGMIVGDDGLRPPRTAGERMFREAAPVDLGLRGGDVATQHPALAGRCDAGGDQDRAIGDSAVRTHLLVTGVEKEARPLAQGTLTPGRETRFECVCGTAPGRKGSGFPAP